MPADRPYCSASRVNARQTFHDLETVCAVTSAIVQELGISLYSNQLSCPSSAEVQCVASNVIQCCGFLKSYARISFSWINLSVVM